jgi:hypothetical protein
MALPLLAPVIPRRLDPRDTLDIYVSLTQGTALRDVLQPAEEVTSFGFALTAEAAAAGLTLLDGGSFTPRYANRVFRAVVRVDPAMRGASIFNGTGVTLGIELTFATNMSEREKQYTIGVKAVNK